MDRFLIVTADDLGHDAERNRGIFEAHRRGIVTSASILANGPAFEDAMARLGETRSLFVGLHLNLSEWKPLARGLSTLVGPDGFFLGKEGIRTALKKGRVDPGEIRREVEAQIAKLLDRGIPLTHLDGHQHVHVYPVVREAAAEAAARMGLCTVRIPAERLGAHDAVLSDRRAKIRDYVRRAVEARPIYRKYNLSSTGGFLGMALSGRVSVEALQAALAAARGAWVELMTHPGYPDLAAGAFSNFERETELEVLTDPSFGAWVRERFRLTTYADLVSGAP